MFLLLLLLLLLCFSRVEMKQYRLSSTMNRKSSSFLPWFSLFLTFPFLSSSQTCIGFRVSCSDPKSICFPSTQSNLPVQTRNAGSGQSSSSFALSNGGSVTCSSVLQQPKTGLHEPGLGKDDRVISCKAPLIPDNWMRVSNGIIPDLSEVLKDDETGQMGQGLESSFVEINPPILDWGEKSLFSASFKTLNLKNLHNESDLQVFEPFSSDPQFYAYEFEGVWVKPGENISISFVFLPRILGANSAQIVIQTNFGGFILQAKGLAIDSPFKIEPLIGLELQIGGILSENLSIYNPFDDVINVEELAVWISASESVHQSNHAICKLDDVIKEPSLYNEWFSLSKNGFELVKMDLKPGKKWEISPNKEEGIVELRLQGRMEGKFFGAICVKLRNGTTQKVSTIVVPFDLQVHKNIKNPSFSNGFGPVSLSFDRHLACDRTSTGTIFSLYLKNEGLSLLTVLNIIEEREGEKLLEIKYVKNLLIFPQSETIVGLVSSSAIRVVESVQLQCNLVVETNSSFDPLLKIPCSNLLEKDKGEVLDANQESLGVISEDSVENNNKIRDLGEIEASEIIISNWISHATKPKTEYSILPTNELFFPPLQTGSRISKPIPVKNPSPNPIVIQLILNSEELISDCKKSSSDDTFTLKPPKIGEFEKSGFWVADPGLTEVLLNPFESALLGPVLFQPSRRCNWFSSALIRSNLTGVESVFLKGSGGSYSLALLEGSEPVWKLHFDPFGNPNLEKNSSSLQNSCPSCDYDFSKDLFAKNTGELPLEVKKIRVSGNDCNSDGFSVTLNCKGFRLNPDETARISVLYRPDFSTGTGTVERDLQLVSDRGVFVIPMRVTVPACMISQCKKNSAFWRVCLLISLVMCFVLVGLVFVRFNIISLPVFLKNGTRDYYSSLDGDKNNKNNNCTTTTTNNNNNGRGQSGKKPLLHHANKGSRPAQQKQSFINTFHSLNNNQTSPKRVEPKPATPTAAPLKPTQDLNESPQPDLTIKVLREKGKKRNNRKRNSNNLSSLAKLEASSSLSGNSTPSSPLSNGSVETRNPFCSTPVKNKKKEKLAEKKKGKITDESLEKGGIKKWSPVGSPVFSGVNGNSPSFFSRAPGPNKEKSGNNEQKEGVFANESGFAKEFVYDIWADHFAGRWVCDEGQDGNCSTSFFAIEPLSPNSAFNANGNGNGPNGSENGNVTGVYGMN